MRVLVGWSGRHGSTRDIAARIAARLSERGLLADLRPLGEVQGLTEYAAVVLGSPLYSGAWTREANAFLSRCRPGLATRPVWAFTVCMKGTQRGLMGWLFNSQTEPPQVATLRAIAPDHTHRLFSGRIRRQYLPLAAWLFYEIVGGRYGDFRDWAAIEAWADGISERLSAVATGRTSARGEPAQA